MKIDFDLNSCKINTELVNDPKNNCVIQHKFQN